MNALQSAMSHAAVWKLGWVLVHSLWQLAAVGVVLAIVLGLLRKASANARYLASCVALVLMVVLPIVTLCMVEPPGAVVTTLGESATPEPAPPPPAKVVPVDIPVAEVAETAAAPVVASELPGAPWAALALDRLETCLPYLVLAWLVGVFALSLWHLGGWAQLQRLKRRMVEPVAEELRAKADTLAKRLGISRAVAVVQSALVQVPTVIGWLKPMVLLPAGALTGLSAGQLEALLAHELAHIRRHDYLVNMIQMAIEILGFYHPVVWWVSRRIRIERENCCDDMAAGVTGDRILYADALATMEELRGRTRFAMAASAGSLLARIRRLAGKEEGWGRSGWLPAVAAVVVIAALVAVGGKAAARDTGESLPGLDTVVDELRLEPGWWEGDTLTNLASRVGVRFRVDSAGRLDPATRKAIPNASYARFRRVPTRDVLAWILYVSRLSARVSDGCLCVSLPAGPAQVPENLAIRPKPARIDDLLPEESRNATISLREKTAWKSIHLLTYLCRKAGVNYMIAGNVGGGTVPTVTPRFDNTPIGEAFGSALDDSGCELLVDRNTVFIRRFPIRGPVSVTGRVTDAETGDPVPSFLVVPATRDRASEQAQWNRSLGVRGSEGRFEIALEEWERDEVGLVRVEAAGYLVTPASLLATGQTGPIEIEMKPGKPPAGRVLLPDGRPAAGATVVRCTPRPGGTDVRNGRPPPPRGAYRGPVLLTDKDGRFSLLEIEDVQLVVVLHDAGYLELTRKQLQTSSTSSLLPWARVTGTVNGKAPAGKRWEVKLSRQYDTDEERAVASRWQYTTTTDERGRFEFDRVRAGRFHAGVVSSWGRKTDAPTYLARWIPVTVDPGGTRYVDFGGAGRSVVGRIASPPGLDDVGQLRAFVNISRYGDLPMPPEIIKLPEPDQSTRLGEWAKTPKGREVMSEWRGREDCFDMPSGPFRIDGLPPGPCRLYVWLKQIADSRGRGAREVGSILQEIEIPELSEGDGGEPLDQGTLNDKPVDKRSETSDNPLGLEESVLRKLFFTGKTLRDTVMECGRFHREHGRWPVSMQQLHGDSPGESGRDPFSGGPYRVTTHNGDAPAVRIWSLGPDGDWDGGRPIDSAQKGLDGDIAIEIEPEQRWLADETMQFYLEGRRLSHYLASLQPPAPPPVFPEEDGEYVWGKVVDGLQAALEIVPKRDTYALGEALEIQFRIRNAGRSTLKIAGDTWRQGDVLTVTDENAKSVTVEGCGYSGWSESKRETLKPGQTAVFKAPGLAFVAPNDADRPGHPVGKPDFLRDLTAPQAAETPR